MRHALLACTMLATPALAEEAEGDGGQATIVVTGQAVEGNSATKTATPPLHVPQPVTVIDADLFEAQGAVSIGDTLNYVAGVQPNPYGPDSRVDGAFVRGINALQFRDGMRDIFSYYASIRADPYNFSSVEVVRGPASVRSAPDRSAGSSTSTPSCRKIRRRASSRFAMAAMTARRPWPT